MNLQLPINTTFDCDLLNFCSPFSSLLSLPSQKILLEYGFAFDEPEVLEDGTVCEITMNKLLAHRSIKFDETELRLGSNKDSSGLRSTIHTNPNLNHLGARHTRSSGHIKGGVAVNGAGELLPPLIIFSSNAEKEEKLAVQDGWLATFGKIKGKYGHKTFVERLPYVAVRKSGSMDLRLFREMIEGDLLQPR